MAPIRKGDGTPLEIPGVQEVRSGDGRVFFDGDAIPDSEDLQLHHDASDIDADDGDSIISWPSGIAGPTLDQGEGGEYIESVADIDGQPSVHIADGDLLYANQAGVAIEQPFLVFGVVRHVDFPGDSAQDLVCGVDPDGSSEWRTISARSGEWWLYAGEDIRGGTPDTDWHYRVDIVDGGDSELRLDGTEITTGDAGSREQGFDEAYGFGGRIISDTAFSNSEIAEVGVYDNADPELVGELEDYMREKYGFD